MTLDEAPGPPLQLAAEFPPATEERWLALVAKALTPKGASEAPDPHAALAALTAKTYDGITIRPLYTPALDAPPLVAARGAGWQVRQVVRAARDATGSLALEELEKGATAITLDLGGTEVDSDALDRLLTGVLLDLAPISLRPGVGWPAAAAALLGLWERRGHAPGEVAGVLGADPLGDHLASVGRGDVDEQLRALTTLASQVVRTHPEVRVVAVDGTIHHDAGASDGQELGGTIAAGVAYLRALVGAGIPAAEAFRLIELQLAAGADQFATIAKFRAVRRMWARVAEVLGVPAAAAATGIHATTSSAMMTAYDPWVNLLRTTIACFAAGVGGADSITVLPFDELIERDNDELGRRMARNTQSILALESNLSRVFDPAAGSGYVEQLTMDLADAGWSWFQEIEGAGGFAAAASSGLVADRLAATWEQRRANLDARRDPITGVSEFPDIGEPAPRLREATATGALPRHRYAERFEDLRQRVDRHSNGAPRPVVFLAAIGTPASSTARITFAKNFFEVAGIATMHGPDDADDAAIVAAFVASGAGTVCLCSSDKLYGERGVGLVTALAAAGASRIFVAGRPRGLIDDLDQAGATGYLAAGADAYATLARVIDELEIR